MEILFRGTPPNERTFFAKCNNCASEIRFKEHEGVVTRDQRDGDFITIICPICSHHINKNL